MFQKRNFCYKLKNLPVTIQHRSYNVTLLWYFKYYRGATGAKAKTFNISCYEPLLWQIKQQKA